MKVLMKTILVVDDDQMLLEMYQMKFSRLGYNLQIVSEPQNLLQEIEKSKPAIILLDRRLGNVDGLQLLKNIRRSPAKDTPAFLLTNMEPTAEEMATVKALGNTEYLIKEHNDLNTLSEKIKNLIGAA